MRSLLLAVALLSATPAAAWAQGWTSPQRAPEPTANDQPPLLRDVRIEQRLGASPPRDLVLRDEAGAAVRWPELLGRGPVLLSLGYYRCPMLCRQVLGGVARSLRELSFVPGRDLQVVVVSIDPREGHELAARRKRATLRSYGRPETAHGWHFLTGTEHHVRRLADAVGFRYAHDALTDQYAHAAGIFVLSPDGRVSRVLYGIDYATRDLRLALVEASQGRIGSPVDQVLLACFQYDPHTGRYGVVVMRILKGLGLLTLLGMTALVLGLRRRGRPVVAEARHA